MLEVWKFPLEIDRVSAVEMPVGSRILKVAEHAGAGHAGKICLWALVDPEMVKGVRLFRIAGTGHSIYYEDATNFVETVILSGGEVFHVFDVTK